MWGACPSGQWECVNEVCIDSNRRFNVVDDCGDNSDEVVNTTADICPLNKGVDYQYHCGGGGCIVLSSAYDYSPDCGGAIPGPIDESKFLDIS